MKSNLLKLIDSADRKMHDAAKRARKAKMQNERVTHNAVASYFEGYRDGAQSALKMFEA